MKKYLKIDDLSKTNVFSVPENYFAELPENVLQKIGQSTEIRLADISKDSIFEVPANYFEELPNDIQQKIALWNGFTLAQVPKKMIFTIPANYFEELPQTIQQKIRLLNEGQLEKLPKKPIFEVPTNYFDSLADKIIQKTSEKQALDLSQLPKNEVFSTPENYFEDLPLKIQQKIWLEKTPRLAWAKLNWAGGLSAVAVLLLGGLVWFNLSQSLDNQVVSQKPDSLKIEPKKELETPQIVELKKTEPKLLVIDNQIVSSNPLNQTILKNQNQKANELAVVSARLQQVSRKEIVDFLETEDLANEEMMDLLAETQQAAAEDLLFALESDEEEEADEEESLENALKLSEKDLKQLKKLISEDKKKND